MEAATCVIHPAVAPAPYQFVVDPCATGAPCTVIDSGAPTDSCGGMERRPAVGRPCRRRAMLTCEGRTGTGSGGGQPKRWCLRGFEVPAVDVSSANLQGEDQREIRQPTRALVSGDGRAGGQPKRRRLRGFEADPICATCTIVPPSLTLICSTPPS
jgi:hypothetical protein